MSVEQVGPGGVSNSYGVRGTSAKQEYDNDKEYKEVFVPKDTIPLTATVSPSGGVGKFARGALPAVSVGDGLFAPIAPRWWSGEPVVARPVVIPGESTLTLSGVNGGAAALAPALSTTYGAQAVEISVPGGASAMSGQATTAIDVDLYLSDTIVVYLYVPPDVGSITTITAELGQAGHTSTRTATLESAATILHPGAGVVAIGRRLSEFTGGAGPIPGDELTTQNYLSLRVKAATGTNPVASRIQVLHVEIIRRKKPMVCVTADDGLLSMRDIGIKIYNQQGVPMTCYLIAGRLYGNAATISWDDARRLRDKGNAMCNHTYSHFNISEGMAVWKSDVSKAIDTMISEGFEDGARHLAWVQGSRNAESMAAAREVGLLSARNVLDRGIYGSRGFPQPYDFGGIETQGRTDTTVLALVDTELNRGADCTIVHHEFSETENSGITSSRAVATAIAKGLRARVDAGKCIVGTIPELYARRQAELRWALGG